MQKKQFLLIVLLLCKVFLFSQFNLSGIVVDEKNELLPFVNILINEILTDGVSSDIDGKFKIESDEPIVSLTLSYVGYKNLIYEVQKEDLGKRIKLKMTSATFNLTEAVVIAGENPAHRIIKKVVKNRDKNNPEKMQSFQCITYNKVVIDFLPNKKNISEFQDKHRDSKRKYRRGQVQNFDKLLKNAEAQHLMLMESVTERKFLFPEKNSEHVLHNRVSGFKNPSFVALANNFQPFSFYGNHFEILDKAYLNPISPNSTKKYFFNIEDTLFQKTDTVFVISYHPKKGKNFEGLKGLLYINTNGYALQNVIAEPNDKSFIQMKIEQRYVHLDGKQWFPEQLNFEIEATKYPNKDVGTRITGKSYIDQVQLNIELDKKDFNLESYTTDKKANRVTDSIWQKHRPQILTEKEEQTYVFMDSVGAKIKLDQMLNAMEALASGKWSIGKVDVLLSKVLSFNNFEDVRLGLGLQTNEKLSRHFELGGYGGYGIADKKWKYGGVLLLNILPQKKLQLELNYLKEIKEPATLRFSDNSQIFDRQFYATQMDNWERKLVHLKGRVGQFLQAGLSLEQSTWQPQYEYFFDGSDIPNEQFNFTEVGVDLRFAFREKIVRFMGTEFSETRFPLVLFSYKKGIDDFLKSDFDYHQFEFSLYDDIRIRNLGETSIRMTAGWTNGKVPYSLLYTTSGIGSGFQWVEIPFTFQTMQPYEFLSDRFVNLFFEHNFETLLLKYKKFKPEFSIVQNIGWGDLKDADLHEGVEFKTMEKGFFESGFRVDNLVRFNYFNIMYVGVGGGIYYRFGNYALPTLEENLAYRFRIKFSF